MVEHEQNTKEKRKGKERKKQKNVTIFVNQSDFFSSLFLFFSVAGCLQGLKKRDRERKKKTFIIMKPPTGLEFEGIGYLNKKNLLVAYFSG